MLLEMDKHALPAVFGGLRIPADQETRVSLDRNLKIKGVDGVRVESDPVVRTARPDARAFARRYPLVFLTAENLEGSGQLETSDEQATPWIESNNRAEAWSPGLLVARGYTGLCRSHGNAATVALPY